MEAPTIQTRRTPLGEQVVQWFGDVAAGSLAQHPTATRRWLQTGYELMRAKVHVAPDPRLSRSGQVSYQLFMDSIVSALAHPQRSVLTSIFTPPEPFQAMGVLPMCAEAMASFLSGAKAEPAFIDRCEACGLPETYCSYHKALMGMAASGVLEPRPMVACTSVACDANNLSFKTLARQWGVPHAYVDVPYEVDEDSIRYVAGQLREMVAMAQDCYHATLDEEDLRRRVAVTLATDALLERTLPGRASRYRSIDMTVDMMQMLDFHLSAGTRRAWELAGLVRDDQAAAKPYQGVSLVWAHVSPFFLEGVGQRINFSQEAQIVATDMGFDHLVPPGGLIFGADQPYEAMAERVVRNCYNGPVTRRAETLVQLAQRTGAQGAVVFCHWGCKETAGGAQLLREALEEAGFPALVLDGDALDRRNCMPGQLETRLAAFLEMLRARKEA